MYEDDGERIKNLQYKPQLTIQQVFYQGEIRIGRCLMTNHYRLHLETTDIVYVNATKEVRHWILRTKTRKLKKICTDAKISDRTYGNEMSEKIQMRIGEIEAADTVEEMLKYRIGRCHTLTNNRKVVLGIPAKFWNNLEAVYREKLIKVKAENAMDDDKALDYRTNLA